MATPSATRVKCLSKELQTLLKDNEALFYNEQNEKVWCTLSGHEMPCTSEAVQSYVRGKKYKKLLRSKQFSYNEFSQHIVLSTRRGLGHLLFCKLTLRHINNTPHDIDLHVKGQRFQKELKRWEECQKTGEVFKSLSSFRQKGPSRSWDRPQKKENKGDSSDQEQEEDGNESDLSDLYPKADFPMTTDANDGSQEDDADIDDVEGRLKELRNTDSDFEFEDMDARPSPGNEEVRSLSSREDKLHMDVDTTERAGSTVFSHSKRKRKSQQESGPAVLKKQKKKKLRGK